MNSMNSVLALKGGHIRYILLKTFDLERVVTFYRDVLGLTEVYAQAGEFSFLKLPNGGPDIALYSGREPTSDAASHWLLIINVDDLDCEIERLRRHEIEITDALDVPYGRAAYLKDPEGNALELHQANPA
jgi:predicted enzyme related to lactoylglutathione lyase